MLQLKKKKICYGNSLVVQWLGLRAFAVKARVQSLIGERRSHKPYLLTLVLGHVWLFVTLMDCSPLASSVHEIFQARILEWVAISSSWGYSQPRDQTHISPVPCICRRILYSWATREAHELHSPAKWKSVIFWSRCYLSFNLANKHLLNTLT